MNNPTTGTGQERAGQFQRRLHEFGPRTADTESDSISIVSGLKGVVAGNYDWEIGINYSEQSVISVREGFAKLDAINARVRNGTLNLFNPIDEETVRQLSVKPRTDGESALHGIDLQLSGELFDMVYGPAQFALVAEANHQEFVDERDADTLNGNIVGLGGTAGAGERDYMALGMELLLPLADRMNLSFAARYDKYNDDSNTDDAVSPKLSFEYRPVETLLLRASAGRSFRAPDMQRLFGAQTRGFATLIDTPTCIEQGGSGRGDASVPSCITAIISLPVTSGSNIELEEEKGKNFNAGVVWQASDALSFSLDMFSIELKDIVATPSFQDILDNPSSYDAESIQRLPENVNSGNPTGLTLFAVADNLSYQKMTGADLTANYRIQTENYGDFRFKMGTSHISKFETQVSETAPVVDELRDRVSRINSAPQWKANGSVTWSIGDVGSTLYLDYVGDYSPINSTIQKRIPSYFKVNLSGYYNLPWSAKIQVGVNNLFDRQPPLFFTSGTVQQSPFYDQTYHDLLGRNYYVEYTETF